MARELISVERLQTMAVLAARMQGTTAAEAKAPPVVMKAVRDLHDIGGLAAGVLLRRRGAEAAFRKRLTGGASGADARLGPDRRPGSGRRTVASMRALASIGDTLGGSKPCTDRFQAMQQVLEAAFVLDVRAGRGTATHTMAAGQYIRDRTGTVEQFEQALVRPPSGGELGGLGDPTDPVLPPDMGIPAPDDPSGGGIPDRPDLPDLPGCRDVTDLCVALFEESLAALAGDPYIDLIASVSPDCLCSNLPADQELVAHPAPGREFPVPLPPDVNLYYRGENITSRILSLGRTEVRFRLPPDPRTGFLYFRGLLPLEGAGAGPDGDIARVCGVTAPPDFPAIVQKGPVVRISIVHPPVVIDLLASDGQAGPETEAEACVTTDLCWRARLSDQPPHLPLPPCASITVTVRDSSGAVVAEGGAQGCVAVKTATDETYTAVARSFAGTKECGTSDPVSLTVRRVAKVHLTPETPTGPEVMAGSTASVFVDISCPAGRQGQTVRLSASRSGVLDLPTAATIPSGQTRARVEFEVLDDACGDADLRASSPGHASARLRYNLLHAPVLGWALTHFMPYAPPRARAFAPFSFTITASCLPQPESRVSWRLVRTDAGGQGEELPITVYRPGPAILQLWPEANFLFVHPTRPPGSGPTLSPYDPIPGLTLGTWAIVADVADLGLTSNLLEFQVDLCGVDLTLDSVSVLDTQARLEGDLELYLTAVVEPDPPPVPGEGSFLPSSSSLRWPPYPASFRRLGNGETDQPRARITSYQVTAGTPAAARVHLTIRESDSFLLFDDDVEVADGTLVVSCEAENVLDFTVVFGEQISATACQVNSETGQTECSSLAGPATVRVRFKATPRMGP